MPRQPARSPSKDGLAAVLKDARVPVWSPWPLPMGWLVAGFVTVGDDRSGVRAAGVAVSGPGLVQGPADILLIAEEPGIGLGAYYAGLKNGPDPGVGFDTCPPHVKVEVSGPTATSGHSVPMWMVRGGEPDRAVYVGEALGNWVWAILWPADAGALLSLERPSLLDLREPGMDLDLPYGAQCPRLHD